MNKALAHIARDYEDIADIANCVRASGKTIVTMNGCFDLVHSGHVYFALRCAEQGDCLICCMNSDDSVRRLKGPERPYQEFEKRSAVISAFRWVDYIVAFEEDDPRAVLEYIKPDVHCNGAEYGINCVEAETVKRNGGRIVLVDRMEGFSTTEVVASLTAPETS